jgi:hypothetical protein
VFVGWGSRGSGKRRTLTIQIVPKGKPSKVSITVPNTSSKSADISPVKCVANLADSLKIGDSVKVGYSSLGGRTWVTSLSKIKSSSTGTSSRNSSERSKSRNSSRSKGSSTGTANQDASNAFIFIRFKKRRTSSGIHAAITARRGSLVWTFYLPPETTSSKSKSTSESSDDSQPDKPATLSEQASVFKAGDKVVLGYKTLKYHFVLENIIAYQMFAYGSLVKVSTRNIRGTEHDMAIVKTAEGSLSLVVPLTTNNGGGKDMSTLLKAINVGQPVEIKYRRQGGILWLDRIVPSTTVTAK